MENTNSGEICGGAIINKRKGKDLFTVYLYKFKYKLTFLKSILVQICYRFILTAAHCTENFRKDGEKPTKFPGNILGSFT